MFQLANISIYIRFVQFCFSIFITTLVKKSFICTNFSYYLDTKQILTRRVRLKHNDFEIRSELNVSITIFV